MSPSQETVDDKMTIEEVAAFLECTVETVEINARTGRLAAVKHGRSWVFLRSALIEGLRQEALDNLRNRPKPMAGNEEAGYAAVVPTQKRRAANTGSRTRPRPVLPRLGG